MGHSSPRRLGRLVGLALCALGLASCNSDGGDAADRLSAATYGPISSPAFDSVQELFSIGAPVETAQVLLVDGDARAAGELAKDAVVQKHLRSGRWVVLVDLTSNHNRLDVVPLAHAAGAGDSRIAIMRRRVDAFGRPQIDLYDFPRTGAAEPTAAELAEMKRSVKEFLAKAPAQAPTDFTPPDGLIYVVFNFSTPVLSYEFIATKGGTDTTNGVQYTSVNKTFVYSLFLNNAQNPTGDFQQLVVHGTVASSPLNPAMGTNALMITKTGSGFVTNDIGWFQVGLEHAVTAADAADFTFVNDSPQNTNGQAQVTSGLSFDVNFTNPMSGGGASFTYSDSVTYDVFQWNVDNPSSASWSWQNQDPWKNGNTEWGYGYGGGLKGAAEFRVPNSLAGGLLIADTKTLYSTASVLSSVATFNHATTITYLNVWSAPFDPIYHQYVYFNSNSSWQIDMGAVIPVPIASVTYSANPVNAASVNQVTGTVTLASAAPMDTLVYLQSDSGNATVLPSVTIKQGQTSATFQILVNTNGIPSGGSTVATILASNAVAFQSQLTVKNGP